MKNGLYEWYEPIKTGLNAHCRWFYYLRDDKLWMWNLGHKEWRRIEIARPHKEILRPASRLAFLLITGVHLEVPE